MNLSETEPHITITSRRPVRFFAGLLGMLAAGLTLIVCTLLSVANQHLILLLPAAISALLLIPLSTSVIRYRTIRVEYRSTNRMVILRSVGLLLDDEHCFSDRSVQLIKIKKHNRMFRPFLLIEDGEICLDLDGSRTAELAAQRVAPLAEALKIKIALPPAEECTSREKQDPRTNTAPRRSNHRPDQTRGSRSPV